MKLNTTLIVAVGFAIGSCSKGRETGTSDEISGVYAREYSFTIVNPESGREIGMRTIRDTIFIRSIKNGYQVSNNRWRMNDFDKDGWQNARHSEDRPMPSFSARYDNEIRAIVGQSMPPLYFDQSQKLLWKGRKLENQYEKIE